MTTTLPAYDEVVARYEPVIGLETHVELGTNTKMWCGCPTDFGGEPNTRVCPVCLGLPGSLPVANKAAIEATIRIGLALNCSIAEWCRFARKNYFYPDMPKNFQISQYDEPLCFDGHLDVDVDGELVRIGIERVHLEEDTGKTLHVGGATGRIHGATESLVDYNRAGIPLVEIVTKPIPGTGALAPEIARAYVAELRDVIRSLGVSDVRMEEGSLRCDVNTSLNLPGAEWGTRTETKNVNSLRSVERAVRSEMLRQASVLDAGGRIVQETRHFHEDTGDTTSGRSKETATDYRYFPEPDLVPLAPDTAWVAELKAALPELPRLRRKRIQQDWGLSDLDMQSVVNAGAVELIEVTVAAGATPAAARKWWLGELSRRANETGVELADIGATPGAGGRASGPGRRRQAQRQAGPHRAGGRGGRRGLADRDHDRPQPGGRLGHRRAHRRRGRGDRGQPGHRRQDPQRQGRGGRRVGRRRHEDHPRPGGRQDRPRVDPGAPRRCLTCKEGLLLNAWCIRGGPS